MTDGYGPLRDRCAECVELIAPDDERILTENGWTHLACAENAMGR
jgi:hypothetical protein